ncbi:hypothetical protein [Streptosporangium roseum]|uniref:hypothetical protein n=1 Tax=Streptosporangium roseum TaxID=2001 RepID=UPI00332E7546
MPTETVDASVHVKAARTVGHDPVIRVPICAIGQHHAIRDHLEVLRLGILSAARTEESVDRLPDAAQDGDSYEI